MEARRGQDSIESWPLLVLDVLIEFGAVLVADLEYFDGDDFLFNDVHDAVVVDFDFIASGQDAGEFLGVCWVGIEGEFGNQPPGALANVAGQLVNLAPHVALNFKPVRRLLLLHLRLTIR